MMHPSRRSSDLKNDTAGRISCIINAGVIAIKASDRQIGRQFKQRIQTLTTVKRAVIFGSRARGKAQPDSDPDIFIEIPQVTPEIRRQIYNAAWEIGFEHGIVISTFLVSSTALVNSPLAANPILRAINEEGIAI